ncbi:MAG: efflux RND transporter periplasmic adaptor subunit [Sulfuricella denitrificans]|nr:efflux RND transporter periplasmic adaptor subunit [Sulfuricella denitrificans]
MNSAHLRLALAYICTALLFSACGKKPEEKKSGPPPAIITVVQAQSRTMRVYEQSIGEAESVTAPKVGAEVAGRIIRVYADIGDPVKKGQLLAEIDPVDYSADAKRLEAQALSQQKLTERYRELAKKGFISPSALENYDAQNIAAREQLTRGAKNLSRTRIVSPVDGRVDNRMVSVGDWIELGKPVFQLSTGENLRIRLPFPESVANRIKIGQTVKLSTPTAPDSGISGKVQQIQQLVGSSNRAFNAVVEIKNPGDWKPGASVNGMVIIEEHEQAVAVPAVSVVLRPAGKVVYVLANDQVAQRIVTAGVTQNGEVEILKGLQAGETVAVDGAGFLTDQAKVSVKPSDSPKGQKQ